MVTVPPPYSPFGISPANLKYSSGWSSTCTARWFFFGSGGMPLGTAHDTPTPSFSRRRSQCSRRAWCSWTTNRGALTPRRGTLAPGSGVRLKSRLASYSASFRATRRRLGHGSYPLGSLLRRRRLRTAAHECSCEGSGDKHRDRQHQGRMYGVDESVREDVVCDRLHLRWELQAGAGLARADLEPRVRCLAEAIDERGPVLLRQTAGCRDRLVVKRQGKPVLQERTDHGACQHTAKLLDRVDHTRRNTAKVCRQVAGRDAEDRRPDEAHAQAADDQARRERPPT